MMGIIRLENSSGLRWLTESQQNGYALGTIYLNEQPVETVTTAGMLFLRNVASGEQHWLLATEARQVNETIAHFSGETQIDGVNFSFEIALTLADALPAASFTAVWQVDRDLTGWEVCLTYHDTFVHPWLAHLYPLAEDSKFIAESPLIYVGVPAGLFYRDDMSLALLFGLDPSFDYLNPTTWTGQIGLYFMDQVTPPQFRVGGGQLKAGIEYTMPMQLILSDAAVSTQTITQLVQTWIALNNFQADELFVRPPDEALALFLQGRRHTSAWKPGIGYRLEEGDPESNFVYIGEQALSAYFEYLVYEQTGDELWRQRAFEQMDFIRKGQNTDPAHIHYGAIHTAYDLGKRAFDSDDRGVNIGYKPDLNLYLARYMLQLWQRVKEKENTDRQDWYQSAILAVEWAIRQRNPDGSLPQKVDIETGQKSISTVSGRALPAMPIIYEITGEKRHRDFALSLEKHLRECAEARFRFTGHHPDLPPDEIEEASIWGAVEYWLDKYDRTNEPEYLERALADAYLSLLWWCPKQLSWVDNPTQFASAEQQHFLQYSLYCYQNRKVQCLHRLAQLTGDSLWHDIYERVLQGIFWTQVTEGDQRGATHERTADPWLKRDDYGEPVDFNSLGTVYMGEQSLDTMLQLVEIRQARAVTLERNLTLK